MFKDTVMAVTGLICYLVALIISFAPYAFAADAEQVAKTMQGIGGTALMVALALVGIGALCHLLGTIAGLNQLRTGKPISILAMLCNLAATIGIPMTAISLGIVII